MPGFECYYLIRWWVVGGLGHVIVGVDMMMMVVGELRVLPYLCVLDDQRSG